MALFAVRSHIDATPSRVWEVLLDWEGSAEWMVDATTVEVLTPQREGVGTKVKAVTRIAGVPLTDIMTVTRWEPERLMQVHHEGWPIRGVAWFELTPKNGGTMFEWAEELDPPLGPFGELGGLLLRRPIERVLSRSVAKLRAIAERA
ncbi:MAG TPA: SRPBCC family protein [Actinomycetota bacterium]|nr:SRPBCC family protein [Actinomycetota bacterium]